MATVGGVSFLTGLLGFAIFPPVRQFERLDGRVRLTVAVIPTGRGPGRILRGEGARQFVIDPTLNDSYLIE